MEPAICINIYVLIFIMTIFFTIEEIITLTFIDTFKVRTAQSFTTCVLFSKFT